MVAGKTLARVSPTPAKALQDITTAHPKIDLGKAGGYIVNVLNTAGAADRLTRRKDRRHRWMRIALTRGRIWGTMAVIGMIFGTLRIAAVAAGSPLPTVPCATIIANPHGSYTFSTITGCNFTGLNMTGVDFHGSTLNNVNFSRADLMHADFSNTTLSSDNFSYANLEDADFCFASANSTNFTYADVQGASNSGWTVNSSDNRSNMKGQ